VYLADFRYYLGRIRYICVYLVTQTCLPAARGEISIFRKFNTQVQGLHSEFDVMVVRTMASLS